MNVSNDVDEFIFATVRNSSTYDQMIAYQPTGETCFAAGLDFYSFFFCGVMKKLLNFLVNIDINLFCIICYIALSYTVKEQFNFEF